MFDQEEKYYESYKGDHNPFDPAVVFFVQIFVLSVG